MFSMSYVLKAQLQFQLCVFWRGVWIVSLPVIHVGECLSLPCISSSIMSSLKIILPGVMAGLHLPETPCCKPVV